jgi:hypothetical protein
MPPQGKIEARCQFGPACEPAGMDRQSREMRIQLSKSIRLSPGERRLSSRRQSHFSSVGRTGGFRTCTSGQNQYKHAGADRKRLESNLDSA